MAIREKLAERASKFLEPSEQIHAVFPAQSGPSPYWSLLSAWITLIGAKYNMVAVTDRSIVVLRNGRLRSTFPKQVLVRAPLNAMQGEPGGLWGEIYINDSRYWVHRRFHKDVTAAFQFIQATAVN
jgi:hypothetical protein